MRSEIRRGFGRRKAPGRAREQRKAERSLQSVDMPADRRLGYPEPPPGARKAAVSHYLEKGAQFVPMRLASCHTILNSGPT